MAFDKTIGGKTYTFCNHAIDQAFRRSISESEIEYAILHGTKDFNVYHSTWQFHVTVNGRGIVVAVAVAGSAGLKRLTVVTVF